MYYSLSKCWPKQQWWPLPKYMFPDQKQLFLVQVILLSTKMFSLCVLHTLTQVFCLECTCLIHSVTINPQTSVLLCIFISVWIFSLRVKDINMDTKLLSHPCLYTEKLPCEPDSVCVWLLWLLSNKTWFLELLTKSHGMHPTVAKW